MSKFSQYEAFVAIVKTGSISLAAESLNRTPSAISKQLANLESSLGVQLFDRSNKRMVTTSHGKQFYQSSVLILKNIRDAENQILMGRVEISGEIRITLSNSLVGSRLTDYLNEFAELYPHTRYDLRFTENVESFNALDIDFAFRMGTVSDSTRLIARELGEVRPIFYVTPAYVEKKGLPKRFSDLNSHRVAFPPLENLSSEVRRWLKKHKFDYTNKIHHRMDDVNAILDMASRGACLGFHLKDSLSDLLENGTVLELFPKHRLPSKKFHLVYRKTQYQSAHLEAFKNFIIDKYGA
ncbi:LysR family transcriptional regulator [Hahella ganghwensis]|uniref:LysR family transcriptional regulator n=1 Tax=Hahella ganghwensis TaxID=286420 RepID=UPI0003A7A23A|nr:LysR family transcriptional regulator [Hahella ganghwensis]